VTEALPDADPPAEVCATALTASSPVVIAAIQNFFMFIASFRSSLGCENLGFFEVISDRIQMQSFEKASTLNVNGLYSIGYMTHRLFYTVIHLSHGLMLSGKLMRVIISKKRGTF
jgi:hypothetical protein